MERVSGLRLKRIWVDNGVVNRIKYIHQYLNKMNPNINNKKKLVLIRLKFN